MPTEDDPVRPTNTSLSREIHKYPPVIYLLSFGLAADRKQAYYLQSLAGHIRRLIGRHRLGQSNKFVCHCAIILGLSHQLNAVVFFCLLNCCYRRPDSAINYYNCVVRFDIFQRHKAGSGGRTRPGGP